MSEAAGEYARSKKTPDACRGHDGDDDGDGDGNDGNGDGVTMVGGSSS